MFHIKDQGTHSNLITMHRMSQFKNLLSQRIRELFVKSKKTKILKCLKMCKSIFSCCCVERTYKEKELMYINETHIDNYIDNYWFINCPKDMPNKLLRHQLHRLIHEIMM